MVAQRSPKPFVRVQVLALVPFMRVPNDSGWDKQKNIHLRPAPNYPAF